MVSKCGVGSLVLVVLLLRGPSSSVENGGLSVCTQCGQKKVDYFEVETDIVCFLCGRECI